MSEQQTVRTTPWWKNKKIIMRIAVAVILVAFVIIAFIITAYVFHWGWTGLPSSHKTTTTTEIPQASNAKKVTTIVEEQPAKTLWDWLPLLIQLLGALAIPIVVGFGTAFFTRQQAKTSEVNAENQQQEELLRTYFDKLSDLLLDEKLNSNPNMQSVVRARTLAALHILSTERKAIILRFLHDADLLQYVKSFLYSLDLSNADLNRIDLAGADLRGAILSGANLSGATLSGANLTVTKLIGANLAEANLSGADLSNANLQEANLDGANLHGADLYETNLKRADLARADLAGANLSWSYANLAILCDADLREAKLIGVNLFRANLFRANLVGADLSGAKLIDATLHGANLAEANLSGADLSNANLQEANLSGTNITSQQLEGASFITSEQLAQIRPSELVVPQEAKMAETSSAPVQSEIQPDQTSQEESAS